MRCYKCGDKVIKGEQFTDYQPIAEGTIFVVHYECLSLTEADKVNVDDIYVA